MGIRKQNMEDSPLNVKEGDIIEALDDFCLHLSNCCHVFCHMEPEFCCSPILLNKIDFAVILWVKIAQMAMQLDQLLKLEFLRNEIGLKEKNMLTTAVSVARRAMKAQALGKKISTSFGPQAMLPNNDLHALELARHSRVVLMEIK